MTEFSEETCELKEAADYLCISISTLRKWLASGRVTARKPGPKKLVFLKSDLKKILGEPIRREKK